MSLPLIFLLMLSKEWLLKLTGMNQLGLVATLQVVEDRSIIEISQIDHVIALLKLRRVDLANLVGLEGFFLEQ